MKIYSKETVFARETTYCFEMSKTDYAAALYQRRMRCQEDYILLLKKNQLFKAMPAYTIDELAGMFFD